MNGPRLFLKVPPAHPGRRAQSLRMQPGRGGLGVRVGGPVSRRDPPSSAWALGVPGSREASRLPPGLRVSEQPGSPPKCLPRTPRHPHRRGFLSAAALSPPRLSPPRLPRRRGSLSAAAPSPPRPPLRRGSLSKRPVPGSRLAQAPPQDAPSPHPSPRRGSADGGTGLTGTGRAASVPTPPSEPSPSPPFRAGFLRVAPSRSPPPTPSLSLALRVRVAGLVALRPRRSALAGGGEAAVAAP